MKVAVTYENGEVFQHFGRTEKFKIFEINNHEIIGSQVVGADGAGHGALSGILVNNQIDVLICGGIGGGAQTALAEAGIELFAGTTGDVDVAVEHYLKGELKNSGITCDHHHHGEGHSCGDHGCGRHH